VIIVFLDHSYLVNRLICRSHENNATFACDEEYFNDASNAFELVLEKGLFWVEQVVRNDSAIVFSN